MADLARTGTNTNTTTKQFALPPPAPPLPPNRQGAWSRLVAPLGFGQSHRPPSAGAHSSEPVHHHHDIHGYAPLPSQTAAHKTGIPIAALDINKDKTHAVLAGHEILKTIRITDRNVTEELNIRSAIKSFPSSQTTERRQFLPASEVKWSHGNFGHIIATAATNGIVVIYDIKRPVQIASLHEHRGQVHKLAFSPHSGHYLLSASQDGTVKFWDMRLLGDDKAAMTMKSPKQYLGRAGAIRDVRWSPTDGVEFVTGSDNGVLQKWDLRHANDPILRINGHDKACTSVDWHPDGRHVVSGGFDKYVRVWDFQSGNRRQKPTFQLRAPHAVMRLRWRPACWSAELANTGHWQSTQLVTSYTQDDPRLHVWDLRRPNIPFRELDRYNSPATDLLWASKDLLWTVGNEGMFTQTDVSFATQVHKELSPCAMDWLPGGEYAVFTEDRKTRHGSGLEDPAVGFLSVRQEKLSSGEEAVASRSLTDDESGFDAIDTAAHKRRQSKTTSARSAKSQSSTPPSTDGPPVLSLEKAVFQRGDLFNNRQIGVVGDVVGAVVESDVIKFLAEKYAPASTENERRTSPNTILQRLEESFDSNADACDMVSLHRMAQSWRVLSAVIVPELKDWAEKNRTERLGYVSRKKTESNTSGYDNPLQQIQTEDFVDGVSAREARSKKVMSNLFKGVLENEGLQMSSEMDSTSNMTTPVARPLPGSPLSDGTSISDRFRSLDDSIETIAPLPPSVLSAHSTAAAASKALWGTSRLRSESPSSSPEQLRSSRKDVSVVAGSATDSEHSADSREFKNKTSPRPIQKLGTDTASQRLKSPQMLPEAQRRVALSQYRGHTRPLLTFDDPSDDNPQALAFTSRHDSDGSFPMFSASTDSSHKLRSLGGSFDSPESTIKTPVTPDGWHHRADSDDFEPSSPPSDESGKPTNLSDRIETAGIKPSAAFTSPDDRAYTNSTSAFGLDGQIESREQGSGNDVFDDDEMTKDESPSAVIENLAQSSPQRPVLNGSNPGQKPQIHSFNPLRLPSLSDTQVLETTLTSLRHLEHKGEDLSSPDYIFSDFRPIDRSHWDPRLPYQWSSVPLIAHAIEFDLATGQGCGQFSAHLLMHVHPFFFHDCFRDVGRESGPVAGGSIAQKLQWPYLSHRITESVLLNHYTYLMRMGHFVPLAELRRLCVEFGYSQTLGEGGAEQGATGSLNNGDPHRLSISCTTCQAPILEGRNVCSRCGSTRRVCPVCSSLRLQDASIAGSKHEDVGSHQFGDFERQYRGMWTFCHSCGHSAHIGCMNDWLSHPSSEGICPSQGCGCDCGPGITRKERIAKQMMAEEETRLVRGAASPTSRKDSHKALPSAAVHKARNVLRDGERGTQSGDERGSFASRRGSGNRSTLGQSQKKSVRLVTPGEQKASQQR